MGRPGSSSVEREPRTFVLVHGTWHGGWDCVALDAPRNAMMTHPELVADTLLGLA